MIHGTISALYFIVFLLIASGLFWYLGSPRYDATPMERNLYYTLRAKGIEDSVKYAVYVLIAIAALSLLLENNCGT